MRYVEVRSCEVCGNDTLRSILSLGSYPLCDDLPRVGDERVVASHPQEILICDVCLTAHQRFQVPKELLFPPSYHYRSRLTGDVLRGMKNLVEETLTWKPPVAGATVLDIGCNDGSLLGQFKEKMLTTVGVDPTDAIRESGARIDYSFQTFFDDSLADRLAADFGPLDYIVMTNVFAHIEDLPELCRNLKKLMGPQTLVVIENHYLGSVTRSRQFDTFYHEHPRTYSARSFVFIAEALDCQLVAVEFPSRYGGNIRVTMSRKSPNEAAMLPDEHEIPNQLEELQSFFSRWLVESRESIDDLSARGPFIGKALPGRAVMLINALEIDSHVMPFILEKPDSPKVGHWVPNTRIEVVPDAWLRHEKPADVVVWAWHIVDEVVSYLADFGYSGRVWTPLPEFRQIASL